MECVIGYNFYIYPTYVVQVPEIDLPPWAGLRRLSNLQPCPKCLQYTEKLFTYVHPQSKKEYRLCKQCQAKANLANNSIKSDLSRKADQRLKNAINWLVSSSKYKRVYSKIDNTNHYFKLNFITLTLPTTEHKISDSYFTGTMLRKFVNNLYYRVKLKNYIWRVEAQANGNIHAHFITDTFVHYTTLRNVWNKILKAEGLIKKYSEKHSKMSLTDYLQAYQPNEKYSEEKRVKAYMYGVATNWENPNTTDVHAIKKINNLAGYLTKYMTKKDDERRKLKCKLWATSQSLSSKNKLTYLCGNYDSDEVIQSLNHREIEFKIIESKPTPTGQKRILGKIYFIKPGQWDKIIKGKLRTLYDDHRFYIRHALPRPPDYESEIIKSVHCTANTKEIPIQQLQKSHQLSII